MKKVLEISKKMNYSIWDGISPKMKEGGRNVKLTLKKWMALKEITTAELAKKAGVSEATICHIRTGKFKPRLDTLVKIAEVLCIEIGDIEF